ncbi:hypothetical protein AB0O31_15935 [Kitasatospora cineracea]|uniref:effector-associated constant component EACC1 n=1 Tax=Kitasatospora cineracea TaxID=88074 RepID=UPI0034463D25
MSEYEISVTVDAGDDTEDALRSLLRWIGNDDELSRTVRARVVTGGPAGEPTGPRQMGGGTFDVVQLLVSSALSAGALSVSVLQWREARRRPTALVLRRGTLELEIPAGSPHDEATVRALTALVAGAPTPLPAPLPSAATTTENRADEQPA